MIFTQVKLTDSSGKILLDPETGEELFADDGCDWSLSLLNNDM